MKRSLKLIALILSVVMIAAAFSACSTSSGSKATDKPAGDKTASGEAPTLKWIVIGGQPNDLQTVTDAINEYSKEKINVKVEFTYLDWGVWGDRVKAILNSGEKFDIMFNNLGVYSNAVAQGNFADITDILSETPDLKSFIPELVWDGTKIKGKIYGVPTYKDSSQTQYWVWDKEIVEKYNIDIANTLTVDKIDPYLYTFKDEIAAGNITGINYALPMTREGINGMCVDYDNNIVEIGVNYKDKEAKVVRVLEQPEIMQTLEYLYKWHKDGITNPDAATLAEGPKWVILGAGQGFPGADAIWGTGRGKPVVSTPFAGPIYSTGTILGSINSIASSSQYKVEALKFLELMNTDAKARNMLAYGIEGTHYKDNGDGTITRIEGKMDDYAVPAYSQATFFTMSPQAPNPADQWKVVEEWNHKAEGSVILGFSFDPIPVENEIAACQAVESRFKSEIYTGAVDPKVKVPEYYAELDKAGLQKVIDEMQKQINEFLGK